MYHSMWLVKIEVYTISHRHRRCLPLIYRHTTTTNIWAWAVKKQPNQSFITAHNVIKLLLCFCLATVVGSRALSTATSQIHLQCRWFGDMLLLHMRQNSRKHFFSQCAGAVAMWKLKYSSRAAHVPNRATNRELHTVPLMTHTHTPCQMLHLCSPLTCRWCQRPSWVWSH